MVIVHAFTNVRWLARTKISPNTILETSTITLMKFGLLMFLKKENTKYGKLKILVIMYNGFVYAVLETCLYMGHM